MYSEGGVVISSPTFLSTGKVRCSIPIRPDAVDWKRVGESLTSCPPLQWSNQSKDAVEFVRKSEVPPAGEVCREGSPHHHAEEPVEDVAELNSRRDAVSKDEMTNPKGDLQTNAVPPSVPTDTVHGENTFNLDEDDDLFSEIPLSAVGSSVKHAATTARVGSHGSEMLPEALGDSDCSDGASREEETSTVAGDSMLHPLDLQDFDSDVHGQSTTEEAAVVTPVKNRSSQLSRGDVSSVENSPELQRYSLGAWLSPELQRESRTAANDYVSPTQPRRQMKRIVAAMIDDDSQISNLSSSTVVCSPSVQHSRPDESAVAISDEIVKMTAEAEPEAVASQRSTVSPSCGKRSSQSSHRSCSPVIVPSKRARRSLTELSSQQSDASNAEDAPGTQISLSGPVLATQAMERFLDEELAEMDDSPSQQCVPEDDEPEPMELPDDSVDIEPSPSTAKQDRGVVMRSLFYKGYHHRDRTSTKTPKARGDVRVPATVPPEKSISWETPSASKVPKRAPDTVQPLLTTAELAKRRKDFLSMSLGTGQKPCMPTSGDPPANGTDRVRTDPRSHIVTDNSTNVPSLFSSASGTKWTAPAASSLSKARALLSEEEAGSNNDIDAVCQSSEASAALSTAVTKPLFASAQGSKWKAPSAAALARARNLFEDDDPSSSGKVEHVKTPEPAPIARKLAFDSAAGSSKVPSSNFGFSAGGGTAWKAPSAAALQRARAIFEDDADTESAAGERGGISTGATNTESVSRILDYGQSPAPPPNVVGGSSATVFSSANRMHRTATANESSRPKASTDGNAGNLNGNDERPSLTTPSAPSGPSFGFASAQGKKWNAPSAQALARAQALMAEELGTEVTSMTEAPATAAKQAPPTHVPPGSSFGFESAKGQQWSAPSAASMARARVLMSDEPEREEAEDASDMSNRTPAAPTSSMGAFGFASANGKGWNAPSAQALQRARALMAEELGTGETDIGNTTATARDQTPIAPAVIPPASGFGFESAKGKKWTAPSAASMKRARALMSDDPELDKAKEMPHFSNQTPVATTSAMSSFGFASAKGKQWNAPSAQALARARALMSEEFDDAPMDGISEGDGTRQNASSALVDKSLGSDMRVKDTTGTVKSAAAPPAESTTKARALLDDEGLQQVARPNGGSNASGCQLPRESGGQQESVQSHWLFAEESPHPQRTGLVKSAQAPKVAVARAGTHTLPGGLCATEPRRDTRSHWLFADDDGNASTSDARRGGCMTATSDVNVPRANQAPSGRNPKGLLSSECVQASKSLSTHQGPASAGGAECMHSKDANNIDGRNGKQRQEKPSIDDSEDESGRWKWSHSMAIDGFQTAKAAQRAVVPLRQEASRVSVDRQRIGTLLGTEELHEHVLEVPVTDSVRNRSNECDFAAYCVQRLSALKSSDTNPIVTISWDDLALLMRGRRDIHAEYVTDEWIQNHFRWIVWKVLSANADEEGMIPYSYELGLHVYNQMLYRYDVEFNLGKRSAVRKILEKDEFPSRCMVLLVANVFLFASDDRVMRADDIDLHLSDIALNDSTAAGDLSYSVVLELTDGWYSICAKLPLGRLFGKSTFRALRYLSVIGNKVRVQGATLLGAEEPVPLYESVPRWNEENDTVDVPSATLVLHWNTIRRAFPAERLGFEVSDMEHVHPLTLRSIRPPLSSPNDGNGPSSAPVPAIAIVVERVYPLMYQVCSTTGTGEDKRVTWKTLDEVSYNALQDDEAQKRMRIAERVREEFMKNNPQILHATGAQSKGLEDEFKCEMDVALHEAGCVEPDEIRTYMNVDGLEVHPQSGETYRTQIRIVLPSPELVQNLRVGRRFLGMNLQCGSYQPRGGPLLLRATRQTVWHERTGLPLSAHEHELSDRSARLWCEPHTAWKPGDVIDVCGVLVSSLPAASKITIDGSEYSEHRYAFGFVHLSAKSSERPFSSALLMVEYDKHPSRAVASHSHLRPGTAFLIEHLRLKRFDQHCRMFVTEASVHTTFTEVTKIPLRSWSLETPIPSSLRVSGIDTADAGTTTPSTPAAMAQRHRTALCQLFGQSTSSATRLNVPSAARSAAAHSSPIGALMEGWKAQLQEVQGRGGV